jgi:hypothetical protein
MPARNLTSQYCFNGHSVVHHPLHQRFDSDIVMIVAFAFSNSAFFLFLFRFPFPFPSIFAADACFERIVDGGGIELEAQAAAAVD